jgi:hypothetical protein
MNDGVVGEVLLPKTVRIPVKFLTAHESVIDSDAHAKNASMQKQKKQQQ